MGTLYIVSTPIGNLQDITLRALRTLFEVDVIACEDTRRTGILLEKLLTEFSTNPADPTSPRLRGASNKKPNLLSYYEQNELQRIPEIITALQNGLNVALVSDAGTPLISDPGFKLVRECIKLGVKVESIPGASSALTALTSSGLPTDKFCFLGYPPKKPGHRLKFFQNMTNIPVYWSLTIILFEAPHKLLKTLEEMQSVFGDIELVICRELTKVYEEIRREKISEAIIHFQEIVPKGEFVILFHL